MKIAIIGTGAMGSVYACMLAEAGHEVWAVDVWKEHVEAIQKSGLRLEGASGARSVGSIHATTDPKDVGAAELYVIATKASGVGDAARAIGPLRDKTSLVLTIQNGLGAGERIAEHMPTDRVLLGVAQGFGASLKGPGHAHHNAMNLIRIGEIQGGLTDRLEKIVEVWRGAGFSVKAFADINQLIWEKFICNVAFSGPCTLFDCTIGDLMADPSRWLIGLGCAREAYAIGRARDVAISFDDPNIYVDSFGRRMPEARPSMLLDHHDGRPSEIDAINGMVSTLGKQLGLPTPFNDVVTAAVKAREATFEAANSQTTASKAP